MAKHSDDQSSMSQSQSPSSHQPSHQPVSLHADDPLASAHPSTQEQLHSLRDQFAQASDKAANEAVNRIGHDQADALSRDQSKDHGR